jgi:hypothetical protein
MAEVPKQAKNLLHGINPVLQQFGTAFSVVPDLLAYGSSGYNSNMADDLRKIESTSL